MKKYPIIESEDGKYFAKVITDGGDDSLFYPKMESKLEDKPKHSITDVIRFLEDRQLEQDWDIRRDAIHYLREYAEKKEELDELIKKETLETHKAVRMTSILAKMLEEKAKEDEVTA